MCVTNLMIGSACLVAARLTSFDIGHTAHVMPDSSTDLTGKKHNIERFYEPERTNFKVGMDFYFDTNTKVGFDYDNGYDSKKMDVSRSLDLSATQYIKLTDNSAQTGVKGTGWSMTFSGHVEMGGEIDHHPCIDSGNVQNKYFCSNLGSIQPYEKLEKIAEDNHNAHAVRFTFKYKF